MKRAKKPSDPVGEAKIKIEGVPVVSKKGKKGSGEHQAQKASRVSVIAPVITVDSEKNNYGKMMRGKLSDKSVKIKDENETKWWKSDGGFYLTACLLGIAILFTVCFYISNSVDKEVGATPLLLPNVDVAKLVEQGASLVEAKAEQERTLENLQENILALNGEVSLRAKDIEKEEQELQNLKFNLEGLRDKLWDVRDQTLNLKTVESLVSGKVVTLRFQDTGKKFKFGEFVADGKVCLMILPRRPSTMRSPIELPFMIDYEGKIYYLSKLPLFNSWGYAQNGN